MKAIIIDDEPKSRLMLTSILAEHHPEIEVIAQGSNVQEGYQLLRTYQPDIVFLDIEMPDGKGFDVLEKLEQTDFQVIFITAHNEYAITAIRFGALDYLLKPVVPAELTQALARASHELKNKITYDQIQVLLETIQNLEMRKLPSRIAISTSSGIIYKKMERIFRLKAAQNYTEIYIYNEPKKILAAHNLGEYVEQFEQYPDFMQVHRSELVNLNYIEKFIRAESILVMKDLSEVRVSRRFKDALLERMVAS